MKLYQKEDFKSTLPYQHWIPYFEKVNLAKIHKTTHNKVLSDQKNKEGYDKIPYEDLYGRNFNRFYGHYYSQFCAWVFRIEKYFSEGLSLTARDYAELNRYKSVGFPFWFPTSYSSSEGSHPQHRIHRMVDKLGRDALVKKRIRALNRLIEVTLDPTLWTEREYQEQKAQLCTSFSEHNYWGPYLNELIKLKTLPKEAFEHLVNFVPEAKTDRFDRIYAWALQVAYPNLNPEVLKAIVGIEGYARNPEDKLWKVIFNKSFGINHLIILAHDYTEAFGKASDLYMRLCLSNKGVLPDDITIRVQHIQESEALKIIEYYLKRTVLKKTAKWERVRSNFWKQNNDPKRFILNSSLPRLRFLYANYFHEDEFRNLRTNQLSIITSIVHYERPRKYDVAYDMGIDFRKSLEYQEYRPDIEDMDELISGMKTLENNPGYVEADAAKVRRQAVKKNFDIDSLKVDLAIVDSDKRPPRPQYKPEPKLNLDEYELKPVVGRAIANHDATLFRLKKKQAGKVSGSDSDALEPIRPATNDLKPRNGQKKAKKRPSAARQKKR